MKAEFGLLSLSEVQMGIPFVSFNSLSHRIIIILKNKRYLFSQNMGKSCCIVQPGGESEWEAILGFGRDFSNPPHKTWLHHFYILTLETLLSHLKVSNQPRHTFKNLLLVFAFQASKVFLQMWKISESRPTAWERCKIYPSYTFQKTTCVPGIFRSTITNDYTFSKWH